MSRALAPGLVYAIGATVASGNAVAELRTRRGPHPRRAGDTRVAELLVRAIRPDTRVSDDGEAMVTFDEAELACLRDACNQALAWMRGR